MSLSVAKHLEFGIFYFSTGEEEGPVDKYRLVVEGARFADQHGFSSVWVPERHFSPVGSLYPNPAVLHAALARETKSIRLCAGSVVLPLHTSLRVAEEWSVVDNLSGGRVGVAFASGWHPDDFTLAPGRYENRQEVMYREIENVKRLWRGEPAMMAGIDGKEIPIRVWPRPVQSELPFWVTAAGNPKTFAKAGEIGANLLTHMFNQSIEESAEKLAIYRRSLADHGFDPASRRVTMMLHTFVGPDPQTVAAQVRKPFGDYLRSSGDVLRGIASSKGQSIDFSRLTGQEREDFLTFVLDRLLTNRVLFGSPESSFGFVRDLWNIGVDEIACQLDFGVATDTVLENLPHLDALRARCARELTTRATTPTAQTPEVSSAPSREPPRSVPTTWPTESLDAIRTRLPDRLDARDFYEGLGSIGLGYSDAFRSVQQVWRRRGEALGHVKIPTTDIATPSHAVHPALLDACFQVMTAALSTSTDRDERDGALYVPVGLRRFRLVAPIGDEVWSHVVSRETKGPGEAALEGDVRVLDGKGNVIAEALGLKIRRVADASATVDAIAGLAYGLVWRAAPPPGPTPPATGGTWLLLADRSGVASQIAARLEELGERALLVDRPAHTGIAAGDIEHVVSRALASAPSTLRAVLSLWPLDAPSNEAPDSSPSSAEFGTISTLAVVHALAKLRAPNPPRLWIGTRGAQAVTGRETHLALGAAALWGFGRTAAIECGEFWGGMIDLDPQGDAEQASMELLGCIAHANGEDQIAVRGGERFVARLVRTPERVQSEKTVSCREDGTYVITGGLGGIGLEVAAWSVRRGARHLVLIGRGGVPERSQWDALPESSPHASAVRRIRALESAGAAVEIAAIDVSDEAAVRSIVRRRNERGCPPIRGLFHAAGIWDDRAIAQMDDESLRSVLRPKAGGAWNLQNVLSDSELEQFVLFSSGASLFGTPGQANYAAANAYLDALAHERRAHGRTALTINWGPWAEVGNAATHKQNERLARDGIGSLVPRRGVAALERALIGGAPQVLLMSIDWSTWQRAQKDMSARPVFREVVESSREGASGAMTATRAALIAAPASERQGMLEREIRNHVARVLKTPASKLSLDQPLHAAGLDSLMAVEIKNRVESEIGLTLPIVALLEGPSITQLAAKLVAQLAAPADDTKASATPALRATSREGELPLSFSQERLWFLEQFGTVEAAYHVPAVLRLRGDVRVEELRRSIETVVQRHETLRTRFANVNGSPVIHIEPKVTVQLPVVDADGRDAADRRVAEEVRRRFDLQTAPLLRALLVRTAPDDHVLVLVAHHIVSDGWSMGVFVQEMSAAYAAFCEGREPTLPALSVQYVDYARWQRERMTEEMVASLGEYWKGQLGGAPPVLELPTDHARPATQSFRGSTYHFLVDRARLEALKTVSQREGVTVFMTLLTAFAIVLQRYSGQSDLVIGTPTAHRNRSELEALIGFFAQTLALRVRMDGDPSVKELFDRVRDVALGAYAHQELPFERLMNVLQPPRNLSHSPVFQTMFLQNTPLPPIRLPGLALELQSVDPGAAKFDLTLSVTETDAGLLTSWEYATSVFESQSIERMAAHFVRALDQIVANTSARISTVDVLTPPERTQLLESFNATERPLRRDASVYELVAEQALRTPDRIAVESDAVRLTYRELVARALRLAGDLRALGVAADSRVGVCMGRSPAMIVAVLGVLAAGGAYVPLDPAYPIDRLRFMLDDASVSIVVTDGALPASLRGVVSKTVVLDPACPPIDATATDARPAHVHLEQLAYVIYTSGSTGRPKGVQVPHRSVVNFIHSMMHTPRIASDDVLLAVVSLSFDMAAFEIFVPLCVGARLYVAPRALLADGAQLLEKIGEVGATIVQATPALFRLLIEAGWEPERDLRVISGGEPLSEAFADAIHDRSTEFWNGYGPTETTVYSTMHRAERAPGSVPMGRPIDNTQIHLLDARGALVPIGVPGEVFIGGDGVTRGYLARPALTAERFVPDPYSKTPGARMYRTGDLAKRRADGTLEYLHRMDHQVKVRGFRVELGEIEAVLQSHASVRQAIVVARPDVSGEKSLVAYVVVRDESADANALRAHLRERLPDYMLPSVIVPLSQFPLTPNGKIDRAALPAPEDVRDTARAAFAVPVGPVEEAIANVWCKLLKLPRVGRNDRFFEIGGHSLLVIRLQSDLEAALGRKFTPVELFTHPTPAALAAFVAAANAEPKLESDPARSEERTRRVAALRTRRK